MSHHEVADVARALVAGMQGFLGQVLPDTTPEHHRSTTPRDWSLLARAWTEAMQECHANIWTSALHDAWCRIMTLLLRSIYKELWYKDANELQEKMEKPCTSQDRPKVVVKRA